MERRKPCSTAILAGAVALCLSVVVPGAAAPEVWHVRLRFAGAGQPVLYLRVQDAGEMRIADSAEALDAAAPVRAREKSQQRVERSGLDQYLAFPEVVLPVSLAGVEQVRAVVSFSRSRRARGRKTPATDRSTLRLRVAMSRRDQDGTKWVYLSTVERQVMGGVAPEAAPVIAMPDPEHLRLAVATKIEGKKARLALQVYAGEAAVDKVLKGGKYPVCTLQVLSAEGRELHTATGNLEKFGFT